MGTHTISLRGVRTNNLAGIDPDVPRNSLVCSWACPVRQVVAVFDTIAAEAGYQLNGTFPPFARNRLPKWTRPEAEHIDHVGADTPTGRALAGSPG